MIDRQKKKYWLAAGESNRSGDDIWRCQEDGVPSICPWSASSGAPAGCAPEQTQSSEEQEAWRLGSGARHFEGRTQEQLERGRPDSRCEPARSVARND
ncbi:hypothetical protein TRAPUB_11133 [Trametes pubescens]|uniref:Uncharacterized protein n=1 Tax=Trametes pubescens TaxID=154538 RepID=A0A1M2VXP3_TRAPU|nr:hypothetical protein TRAPUB_11133 [Trametes pubescens]